MNLEKLTIGQMAFLNSVSTQTLRYYDKKNILKPYRTDKENGYRYYHINQCGRLDMIQYLKSTGAGLVEIKEILKDSMDPASLLKLLESRKKTLEIYIREARRKKNTIEKFIENFEKYEKMYFAGRIFLEYISKRHIYSHKTGINYFENGSVGYEMMMREMKILFHKKNLPLCYFCNVGTIVREENIKKFNLFSDEVFVSVEENFAENVETIEGNWYLCVCSEDFDKEAELAGLLMETIKKEDCQIVGDYICEVILNFPDIQEKPRKLFYKLQIPVKRDLTLFRL